MPDIDEELLHQKAGIAHAMEEQRRGMLDDILRVNEASIRHDADDFAARIVKQYSINIPELDESRIKPELREMDIKTSTSPNVIAAHVRGRSMVRGTEIKISVPFIGDRGVFRMHASSHHMDYPTGHIGAAEVTFTRRGQNLDAAKVRQEFDIWLASIKRHLAEMKAELGNFNERLKAEAKAAVQNRLDKFNLDDELLKGLGFGPPKGT